jgi:ribonuclease HII
MPRPAITAPSPADVSPPLTLGIDEAGRGPILGPMVLAAVALDARGARALTRAGLTDSKKFTGPDARTRRATMAALVRHHARFVTLEVVEAAEIDVRVANGELNVLERECARRMLACAPACARILADGAKLFGALRDDFPALRAYDRGESRHAAVAAASVVAKDERDRRFAVLCDRWRADFGEVTGGGYLNPATRAFLRAYRDRHGDLPPETRRSWSTEI